MSQINEFKLLDIKSDCFDMIIASYAKWLKGEYRFLFSNSLGFGFNDSERKLGDKIYVDKGDIIEPVIKNGMQVIFYNKNTEEIHASVNRDHPVVVELDEYCCYWRLNYQKIHKKHYVILLSYSYNSNVYSCLDTIPNSTNLILSNEFVRNNAKRIYSIFDNGNDICETDFYNAFFPIITKYSSIGMWVQYSMFIDAIDNCSLQEEMKGYEDVDVIHIPLIWNMKNIAFSYNLFQNYLEYVDQDRLTYLIDKLHTIKQYWDIATNILIISFVRKKFDFPREDVKEYLRKAINEMKGFIDQLSMIK